METSQDIAEITKSMSIFQSRLTTLSKDTKAYTYKYTTLDSIVESFRPLLQELGLAIFQDAFTDDKGVHVVTRICHISGQWIQSSPLLVPMGKRDAHSTGSACSYARRYSLSAVLGIVTGDDDDGQAAQKNPPTAQKKQVSKEEWLNIWCNILDRNKFMDYLEARAAHYKHSVEVTVKQLMADDSSLKKTFDIWVNKEKTVEAS